MIEPAVNATGPDTPTPRVGIRIIAIVKLISAALLLTAALGIFHLIDANIGDELQKLVKILHLGPGHKRLEKIFADISGISRGELRALDAGTFFMLFSTSSKASAC